MEIDDPMVSAEWLKDHFDSPDVRIIDATWFLPVEGATTTGREAYNKAHIPGAVFFDIDDVSDKTSPYPHMLPDSVYFSSRVRKLGIGDGHRIVVYDQNNLMAAARVWWMFRVMGHEDIKVLDGGLEAWKRVGGEVDDMPPIVTERHFTPRVRSDLIVSTEQIENVVKTHSHRIIDARPMGRFLGTDPEPREGIPSGHIPGSATRPAADLVNPDGTLKSEAQLSNYFEDRTRATIVTCGSGVSACIIALALARLSNWDAAVYDGSWSEWASDPDRRITIGRA